ncbi:MAG: DUF4338 domain-containing protein [Nitrospirota bacterium]|nr:MAG: DUF4338 domain-containing protein [Nitrospirota bacterium]
MSTLKRYHSLGQSESSSVFSCGREITSRELTELQETVELLRGLSRWELAQTICEHLGWVTATGANKVHACLKLFDKLEAQGVIRLPVKRRWRPRKTASRTLARRDKTNPQNEISGTLTDIDPVHLELVLDKEQNSLFNEYVDRYHYLGYKKPFGCFLRYFIVSKQAVLGCVLMAGAAKSIGARDRWIGWTEKQRLQNLPWVVNNTRFLIFPWIKIKHLASHALGQVTRRLKQDWYERWGYRPLLMETFVDPARFSGVCYQAAGWINLGKTTGTGLHRPGRVYTTTPKLIYVRPLVRDFRLQLCSTTLVGRVHEEQEISLPFTSTY